MIYLYTEQFFWWPRVKYFIKILLGREYRGPQAMVASLLRGLDQLGVPYALNVLPQNNQTTVCVLTGAKVLKWAIGQKKQGMLKYIIAGPDVGIPSDAAYFEAVDRYIFPSAWVGNFVSEICPTLKEKIRVWPAGVETLPENKLSQKRQGFILYYKNGPKKVLTEVIKYLNSKQIPVSFMHYGKYKRQEYLELLAKSEALVFFSNSESQGLALNEAWMANVSTFIYSGGNFIYKSKVYASSPAPYLTAESGLLFADEEDFKIKLNYFQQNKANFAPRQYHLANFTDSLSAKKYLEIMKELL